MESPANLQSVGLHPEFPSKVWVVVEQPRGEQYRLEYDPGEGTFRRTETMSLLYARDFGGAYGWIGGLGTPPGRHCDVILITRKDPAPGEVIPALVCGIFIRRDNDHKVVAIDQALHPSAEADLFSLDEAMRREVLKLYPEVGENEGWFGRQEACAYLQRCLQSKRAEGGLREKA
jgi:inorganic pyrophosphatase